MARTRRSTTTQNPTNPGGVNQTELDQLVTQRVADALAAIELPAKEFQSELKVADDDNVKYTACIILDGALTWWNLYLRTVGIDAANAIPQSKFKLMLIKKYCPRSEEFGSLLGLKMCHTEDRMINVNCWVLTSGNINGNVTSAKPTDIHENIIIA
ncbi:hypothetical protein Tco_0290110 [Tanacetum coccineum]